MSARVYCTHYVGEVNDVPYLVTVEVDRALNGPGCADLLTITMTGPDRRVIWTVDVPEAQQIAAGIVAVLA